MFENTRKVWKLNAIKAMINNQGFYITEMKRAIELLGQPELAATIYNDGIAMVQSQMNDNAHMLARPQIYDLDMIAGVEEMGKEVEARLKLQLDMIKNQGMAYFDNLAKAEEEAEQEAENKEYDRQSAICNKHGINLDDLAADPNFAEFFTK